MTRIVIAFAAVLMLGLAVPATAASDVKTRGSCVQGEAQSAPATVEEFTSRRRNVSRRGWRGHRHWHGHRWHGRRAWHGTCRVYLYWSGVWRPPPSGLRCSPPLITLMVYGC